MQILNIAKLLQYYDTTDSSMHGAADTTHYTQLSAPTVKALTNRCEQLGWIAKAEEGYTVTARGKDLVAWAKHGEEQAYL